MKTKLIRIGNSKGIRIPKPIIEQSELSDEVELIVGDHEIILRSIHGPRQGWEKAFRAMAENKDDELLDINSSSSNNDWDDSEWTW